MISSFKLSRVTGCVAAATAISMFGAFAAETLMTPAGPAYSIVNAAAVTPNSDTVGIADSDLLFSASDPTVIAKHLDEMQALGVQNIRIAIPWATTEPANGYYDWTAIDNMVNAADARGMGVLGVVTTTPTWAHDPSSGVYAPPTNASDYGAFMGTIAARYGSKMSDYEVWNEPNGAQGYSPAPDPAGYTALLKAAYPAIKAANPSATVIGGVLGSVITYGNFTLNPVDFVQQMYADGAAGYFDALSFHPYQYSTEFSQGAALPNSPLNQVTDIHQLMVANGDGSKQIWSSEYGLPTSVVGDQQQATYITDFLDSWSTLSYAGPSFIYSLVDANSSDTTNPENTFGVYTDSWTPKLAAQAISDFIAAHGTPSAAKLAALTASAGETVLPTTEDPMTAMGMAAESVAATINAALQNYMQSIGEALQAAATAAMGQSAPVTTDAVSTQAAAVTATAVAPTATATSAASATAAPTPTMASTTGPATTPASATPTTVSTAAATSKSPAAATATPTPTTETAAAAATSTPAPTTTATPAPTTTATPAPTTTTTTTTTATPAPTPTTTATAAPTTAAPTTTATTPATAPTATSTSATAVSTPTTDPLSAG